MYDFVKEFIDTSLKINKIQKDAYEKVKEYLRRKPPQTKKQKVQPLGPGGNKKIHWILNFTVDIISQANKRKPEARLLFARLRCLTRWEE